jgi:hypothetical protein
MLLALVNHNLLWRLCRGDLRDLVFDRHTLTLHILDVRAGSVTDEQMVPLNSLFVTESKFNDMVTLRTSAPLFSSGDTDGCASGGDKSYVGTVNRNYWGLLASLMEEELEIAITHQLQAIEKAAAEKQLLQLEHQLLVQERQTRYRQQTASKKGMGLMATDENEVGFEVSQNPRPEVDTDTKGGNAWNFTTTVPSDNKVGDSTSRHSDQALEVPPATIAYVAEPTIEYQELHRKHRKLKLTWSEQVHSKDTEADRPNDTQLHSEMLSNFGISPAKESFNTFHNGNNRSESQAGRQHRDILSSLHMPYNYADLSLSHPGSVRAYIHVSPALSSCTRSVRSLISHGISGLQTTQHQDDRNKHALDTTVVSTVDGKRPVWAVANTNTTRADTSQQAQLLQLLEERKLLESPTPAQQRGVVPDYTVFERETCSPEPDKVQLWSPQRPFTPSLLSSLLQQHPPPFSPRAVVPGAGTSKVIGTTYVSGHVATAEPVRFLVDGQINSRPTTATDGRSPSFGARHMGSSPANMQDEGLPTGIGGDNISKSRNFRQDQFSGKFGLEAAAATFGGAVGGVGSSVIFDDSESSAGMKLGVNMDEYLTNLCLASELYPVHKDCVVAVIDSRKFMQVAKSFSIIISYFSDKLYFGRPTSPNWACCYA